MCRNRFKKDKYCKNTRIDNTDVEKLISRFAIGYISKYSSVRKLCEKICTDTGNETVESEIKHFRQFEFADIDDLAIIIKKIEVFPRNKMYADFIDEKEVMVIWDNRAAANDKEKSISYYDDSMIFAPCLNCGEMVQQVIGRK